MRDTLSLSTATRLLFGIIACNIGGAILSPSAAAPYSEQPLSVVDDSPDNRCFEFPAAAVDFGHVSPDNVAKWAGLEDWHFITNTPYLAVDTEETGRAYLRQKLEPTHKGSIHVVARGGLPAASSYTLTQSFYLEPGFDWGGRNKGGKLGFGLGGGTTPTGGMRQLDGFSARLMWRGNRDGSARLIVYAYSADRSQNLPYGDDYPLQDFEIPLGEWFNVTMEVTANSNTGSSDGRVSVWVNDELKLQRENIHWQSAGRTPLVDHLMYATFHGGNGPEWSPSQSVYARFSSICWQPSTYTPPEPLDCTTMAD